jgi:hypothetical protein
MKIRARRIIAPTRFKHNGQYTIFLAGSIEMGKAEDWQMDFSRQFMEYPINILNPRRENWDSTWVQTIENPQFREQVEWELRGLAMADLIVMYLQPNTISPISLLELGLYANSGKLVVCCPDGFFRKGNIDIVCEKNDIIVCESKNELYDVMTNLIERHSGFRKEDSV